MRITAKTVTVDGLVSAGGLFWGYSVQGDAGASVIFKAGGASGRVLATVFLTAEIRSSAFCLPFGVPAEDGVYVDLTGTITVTTYYSN